ncbi:MAG: hypothetical protein HRT88_23035 [Lentisphaeraceae bacterium]|nr:hypothetical protein [Lentisphaeraceae bacterium]
MAKAVWGAVFLAEGLILSRSMAIKFMHRQMLANPPGQKQREQIEPHFICEAKSAACINHPNSA